MSVQVHIVPVAQSEQTVLRHLIELYVYDFSELIGLDVDEQGRFAFPDLAPWWTDRGRHPFFLRVQGKLAGFALVQARSALSGAEGVYDMAEFFVLRKYRRRGVGEQAAHALFARFPGAWELRQRPANVAATAFWRQVIDRYTGGKFQDLVWADATWQGPVQLFRSSSPGQNPG